MKNWLALAVLGLLAASASAEERTVLKMQATCHTTEYAQQYLEENFNEFPIGQSIGVIEIEGGELAKVQMVMYANPESRTVTTTVNFEDDITCVLFMGDRFMPIVAGRQL
jgi:hypothetical protein